MWSSGRGARTNQAGFDRLALTSYLVTALGLVVASLLSGASALGLIGLFAMLPWGIAGWLKMT